MADQPRNEGQKGLKDRVLTNDLCTGCSACVHLCPYFEHYRDSTVTIHSCDSESGRCYAYCPRTPTDLSLLLERLFDPADLSPEMGAVKGLFMTRALDKTLRAGAQHGGTVSALMVLALSEKIIDTAILADQDDDHLSEASGVKAPEDVAGKAGSKFVVSPTVGAFTDIAKGEARRIGVVATPCQALALAKMRTAPDELDKERVEKLKLVVGLFCGWALSWRELKALLEEKFKGAKILGLDIPPSKHQCMEVTTDRGIAEISIDEVQSCVRKNCDYCFDMTCEFADISVGSARSPEGWNVDKGWNQVIVRTELGRKLLDLAREKAVLEFKAVPGGNLEKLKRASMNKKRTCLKNLAEKSGRPDDLIYLKTDDPAVKAVRG